LHHETSISAANLMKGLEGEQLEEVMFANKAPVAECFLSVLKCWRIYQPNVINLENLDITDDHVEDLCKFLKNKNMIKRLNLRKNFISNKGAITLSQWIQHGDKTLTHLDIERNYIGDDGGVALLECLEANYRVISLQLKYGNPISDKLALVLDRELKANMQALEYEKSHKRIDKTARFQQTDRGPDYIRCAIKMTELRNILHLSLPDNMLKIEEAEMFS